MYAHEFFEDESNPLGDPWSVATRLNVALLDKLARGPVPGPAWRVLSVLLPTMNGAGLEHSQTLKET